MILSHFQAMQEMGFEPTRKEPTSPVNSIVHIFRDKICDKISIFALNSELTPIDISDQFTPNTFIDQCYVHRIGNRVEGRARIGTGANISLGFMNIFTSMPRVDVEKFNMLSFQYSNRDDSGTMYGRFEIGGELLQVFGKTSRTLNSNVVVSFIYYLAE